ncbi:hypothetical protein TMatcc_009020 [Talaromyces marneffei ATCC 18224]
MSRISHVEALCASRLQFATGSGIRNSELSARLEWIWKSEGKKGHRAWENALVRSEKDQRGAKRSNTESGRVTKVCAM